jgi:hypothetical protein
VFPTPDLGRKLDVLRTRCDAEGLAPAAPGPAGRPVPGPGQPSGPPRPGRATCCPAQPSLRATGSVGFPPPVAAVPAAAPLSAGTAPTRVSSSDG